jgi:hypothetical protein
MKINVDIEFVLVIPCSLSTLTQDSGYPSPYMLAALGLNLLNFLRPQFQYFLNKLARVFVPGKPFQLSLKFAGKARGPPQSWVPDRCSAPLSLALSTLI